MQNERKEQFENTTLRYFAEQRNTRPKGADSPLPFPKDWFDLPEKLLADFGAVFFLAALTEYHRRRSMAEMIATIEPPLRLGQYRIFYANGFARAAVTWAGLGKNEEYNFAVNHVGLQPHEWNSGPQPWLVDVMAPFGHVDQIVPMMAKNPNVNCVRALHHNKEGSRYRVMEWQRPNAAVPYQVRSFGVGQFRKRLLAEEI